LFKSLNGDGHGQTEQSNPKSVRHSFTTSFRLRKERLLTNDVHNIDSSYSVLSVIRGNGGERIARINEKPR
jgi:hypothetical protein